jgi:uncharacterized membrane protein YeaQ/YmgE (transglycosylase-associated protein family)
MEVIAWIILGFIAGGIASLLVPGRTPLGCIGVILVGIAGALLGGFLFEEFAGDQEELSWVGVILVAVLGSALILVILNVVSGGRR